MGIKVLINNKMTSVHQVAVQDTTTVKDENGKPKEIFQPARKAVQLVPGLNAIDAEDWSKMQRLFVVKHWLSVGEVEVLDAGPLGKRSQKDAVEVVKATFQKDMLAKWREDEGKREGGPRAAVLDAIEHQTKEITPNAAELGKE